jgi:hypothetical protein
MYMDEFSCGGNKPRLCCKREAECGFAIDPAVTITKLTLVSVGASVKHAILALCAFLLLMTATPSTRAAEEPAKAPAATLEELDKRIAKILSEAKVPGVSVTVIENSQIVLTKGYGYADLKAKRTVTPEIVFRAGSISKSITSIAIMMLVEEGRVHLDDPVSRFIPAFAKTTVVVPPPDTMREKPAPSPPTDPWIVPTLLWRMDSGPQASRVPGDARGAPPAAGFCCWPPPEVLRPPTPAAAPPGGVRREAPPPLPTAGATAAGSAAAGAGPSDDTWRPPIAGLPPPGSSATSGAYGSVSE